jgi:hypothetical protein
MLLQGRFEHVLTLLGPFLSLELTDMRRATEDAEIVRRNVGIFGAIVAGWSTLCIGG